MSLCSVASSSMPIGPEGPAGQELLDDRVLARPHVGLGGELHEPGPVEHGDVVGGAHHRRDVVRDDHEGGAGLLLDLLHQLVEVGHPDRVEARVGLVEQDDLRVHGERPGQAGPLLHAAGHLARGTSSCGRASRPCRPWRGRSRGSPSPSSGCAPGAGRPCCRTCSWSRRGLRPGTARRTSGGRRRARAPPSGRSPRPRPRSRRSRGAAGR